MINDETPRYISKKNKSVILTVYYKKYESLFVKCKNYIRHKYGDITINTVVKKYSSYTAAKSAVDDMMRKYPYKKEYRYGNVIGIVNYKIT